MTKPRNSHPPVWLLAARLGQQSDKCAQAIRIGYAGNSGKFSDAAVAFVAA